jgi:RimJ/RimL family protein N-acetyltransferase
MDHSFHKGRRPNPGRRTGHIVGKVTQHSLSDGVVLLRPWSEADAGDIASAIDGDEEIAVWLDQVPQPYRLEHALAYIRGEVTPAEIRWAVTVDGGIAGSIGTTHHGDDVWEVGYWVRADARGRGLMTRALGLVARWAFEQGAARVQLRADPANVASCRVAEKAGFRRDGLLRSAHWNERLKRRQDWVMYSLLPGELP